MHFRCPNCEHQIEVLNHLTVSHATLNELECPSCHSRFSLSAEPTLPAVTEELRTLGQFQLQLKLGEGAFGTVFKAWDTQLQRPVAIKIPRRDRLTADSARQFLKEARTAARVRHTNVVQVYEVGTLPETFYIASEYIDGVTLADWLKLHPLTPREAAELCIPICEGVQAAHSEKIVHRDLKPGNILMDSAGVPHITDFGLARQDNSTEITVTLDGRLLGTPAYMSPEQARGENSTTGHRADIYALGVTLYEMATGQRPFQASSSQTVIYRLLNEEPTPPRKLNPEIPPDLETIILHAMQKEPTARYATAADMAADLRRLLNHEPILARPASTAQRTSKWIRRNRHLTTALVAAVVMTVVAASSGMLLLLRTPSGLIPVRFDEIPGAIEIRCVPWNEMHGTPQTSAVPDPAEPDSLQWLAPGRYKVTARAADGAFHEVWRSVPESAAQPSLSQTFPHSAWTVDEQGTVLLPGFALFRDSELQDPVVLIRGGTFVAGYEDTAGSLAEKHEQTVESLLVGIHEVSWGQFRERLGTTTPPRSSNGRSYLQLIDELFGDRSEIPDEQPVSGYPLDVALLYCELAGGRLPTSVEWEYVATVAGTQAFPSGAEPVVQQPEDWKILATTEPTADTHPAGIRNLYCSLGEYTVSRMVSYAVMYPQQFSGRPVKVVDPMALGGLQTGIEVRGAPAGWIRHQAPAAGFNVRGRASAPVRSTDKDSARIYDRIGWRLFRAAGF